MTFVFLIPLEVEGHTVPHWKALRCGKFELRDLSCGSTYIICQIKTSILIHKQDFVDSQMIAIVLSRLLIVKSSQEGLVKVLISYSYSAVRVPCLCSNFALFMMF